MDFAVLQEAQQDALHARAHLPELVEEQGAAVGELQLAQLVAVGAGEAALHVPEQLRLEQRLGDAGAVHRHIFTSSSRRVGVDMPGDDVLAHAAFAGNQHLGVAAGDAGRVSEQLFYLLAGRDGLGFALVPVHHWIRDRCHRSLSSQLGRRAAMRAELLGYSSWMICRLAGRAARQPGQLQHADQVSSTGPRGTCVPRSGEEVCQIAAYFQCRCRDRHEAGGSAAETGRCRPAAKKPGRARL